VNIITGNTLEMAMRRVGLLNTAHALDDLTTRQLEDVAEILNIRVTELPPQDPGDEDLQCWIACASRATKLKMYYFLFLSGISLTNIEENIKKELRTKASRGNGRLTLVKR